MGIGDDRTQLLNQLKIDRNIESSAGLSVTHVLRPKYPGTWKTCVYR